MPDSLGDRMKKYEEASKVSLPPRMPIILRLDGKAFHTYTKGMPDRPFNRKMIAVMEMTAIEVCRNIQGATFAYVQSDEISVLIHGYKTFESQSWFDGHVQKMVSVAASVAGATFTLNSWRIWQDDTTDQLSAGPAVGDIVPAYFDARTFVLPEAEVTNYFIWRQQDAIRNSVQSHARSLFSHKQCDNKTCDELKTMCAASGKPWTDLTPTIRQGRVVQRVLVEKDTGVVRSHWETDVHTPLFQHNREYVERHLQLEKKSDEVVTNTPVSTTS